MKVRDLLGAIEKAKLEYPDFLDWDIFTEQCKEGDKKIKRKPSKVVSSHGSMKILGQGWRVLGDSEGWEYFECAGYNTFFKKEKAFTINVNY